VTWWTGSQRLGIATILGFFVIGMILLWPLKDPQARDAEAG
jgi:MFS-type transporter involved in bile tolerance (Atg22 family)